jgi:RNA polymerase sigma-70 factor (ECF subfamily)
MEPPDSTSWSLLAAAAGGDDQARALFATNYAPVVRRYLAARWRNHALIHDLDDAVQDVFLECLRSGGALERARSGTPGGFRAYLFGVVRNVALRAEKKLAGRRPTAEFNPENLADSEETLSRIFDRAWAESLMKQAAARQHERAAAAGPDAVRRVELLRLRFQENLPIRDIAERWQINPALVHRDYSKARAEFRAALLDVLAFHHPAPQAELERQCVELLALLGG